MDDLKVSVCVTLLNEEKSVEGLLTSLIHQVKKADEIIVVDGGSKDKTIEVIRKKFPKIKLIIFKNASRSKGRNIGVKNAKNEIVAITDADCIVDKNWLLRITKPFKKENVDMVAGFYKMTGNSSFQKSLAIFLGVTVQKFSKDFLSSTRSIAFRKSLWREVGGFYEKSHENTGEDTIFNFDAIKNNAKIVRVKNAIVYWEVPNNLKSALKKFYTYAKWDAEYGIWWHPAQKFRTHNIKVLTIFARYILFFLFWPLIIFYLIYAYWKAGLWGTIIQVSSDFAIMLGFTWGILNK